MEKKVNMKFITNKVFVSIILVFVFLLSINFLLSITMGVNFIDMGVRFFKNSLGIYTEEVKSIEVMSDDWNKDNPAAGSWHIDKSAEWTGYKEANITFNLNTTPKYLKEGINYDVVFALDVSTSMYGAKFDSLKTSLKRYLNEVLKNGNNQVSFVEYHTTASVLKGFSNNIGELSQQVDNLELKCKGEIVNGVEQDYGYCTNYYDGLVKVEDVLKGYTPSKNRQLVVLFLTDGYANRDVNLIRGQYKVLKEKYPDMVIHGIQYEMGKVITPYLKLASDYQYDAYVDDIYENFFVATYRSVLESYDSFEITDFINTAYFSVNSEDDIEVTDGSIQLVNEDGKQKIIWNLGDDFKTGNSSKMNIKVKYTGDTNKIGFFPTNEKEEIVSQLWNEKSKKVSSEKTPVLRNGYTVEYEANVPEGCHNLGVPSDEVHFSYETVRISNIELQCDNYIFQGWEITDDTSNGVTKQSKEIFTMPGHDVKLRGVWSTLDISKSMEGDVASDACDAKVFDLTGEAACVDNVRSRFVRNDTGIDFKLASSDTNGKGLYIRSGTENDEKPIFYYRGAVTNNNVLFGNFCWKIVRTTETGGIKLIYNGRPTSSKQCLSTGTSTLIGYSSFNTHEKTADYYNSDNVKYAGYMYNNSRSSVAVHGSTNSNVKTVVDSWYRSNLQSYGGYLEDAVWCNDRKINRKQNYAVYYESDVRLGETYTPYVKDEEVCPQQSDRYTLPGNAKGNGALAYPIALLTADEFLLAGSGTTAYLYIGYQTWSMTPGHYTGYIANVYMFWNWIDQYNFHGNDWTTPSDVTYVKYGVRPAVSLKPGTTFTSGDGEPTNPYIVS